MDRRERAYDIQLFHPRTNIRPLRTVAMTRPSLEANMLLTQELKNKLRRNAQHSDVLSFDQKPVVKFFTPDANATWLFSELSSDGDTLFGLCDLGHGCPELGYASLSEISTLRGRLGLLVERDLHFKAEKALSEYADVARSRGRIVA
jgi:hypothetical protein